MITSIHTIDVYIYFYFYLYIYIYITTSPISGMIPPLFFSGLPSQDHLLPAHHQAAVLSWLGSQVQLLVRPKLHQKGLPGAGRAHAETPGTGLEKSVENSYVLLILYKTKTKIVPLD